MQNSIELWNAHANLLNIRADGIRQVAGTLRLEGRLFPEQCGTALELCDDKQECGAPQAAAKPIRRSIPRRIPTRRRSLPGTTR